MLLGKLRALPGGAGAGADGGDRGRRECWLPAQPPYLKRSTWTGARSRSTGRDSEGAVRIEVVTLFPALIAEACARGARPGDRARAAGGRDRGSARAREDAHRTVDDRPYGGGPGMVLKPEPLCAAIAAARRGCRRAARRIALSAQGELLTQRRVRELAQLPGMVLIAGRYEGIDERVIELGGRPRAVDRRLCVVRRRAAGAGADRCAGAAAARGARR